MAKTSAWLTKLPAWPMPLWTLLLHLFDTGSDALQCVQNLQRGYVAWAAIGAGFVLVAGLVSAVLAYKQKVRGLRLLLYVVGLGPVVEVLMEPEIISKARVKPRLVWVRSCETLLEALPSCAFKFYMVFLLIRDEKDFSFSAIDWAAMLFSVISAGYGVMAMLREQTVEGRYIPAARSIQGSAAVALLVVLGLYLYVFPMIVLFKERSFRPWSVVAMPAALLAFELLLALSCHRSRVKELPYYACWALAACYSIAPHVINLWRGDAKARVLWLSHFGQLLARAAILALWRPTVEADDWARGFEDQQYDLVFLTAFSVPDLIATALVWAVMDAERRYPREAPTAPEANGAAEDGANELVCGCF